VRSADEIDPSYAEALRAAVNAGVEVMAMGVRFTPRGVERPRVVEVILGTRAGLGVQAGRGRVPGAQGPFLSFLLGRRAQRAGR
jgi:sugar fermentation stimulation protein A